MPIKNQSDIPIGMAKVQRRFERWRSSHKGRKPISESLWTAAVEVAREHGIFRTSKALRLEFNKLKRHVKSAGRRTGPTPPGFVELVASESAGLSECLIELDGPRGKMRVQWKGITPPDLAGLSRTLWERK